jgi:ribose/xylose/arabinose/galactoside ABC-type transport system permease subunit
MKIKIDLNGFLKSKIFTLLVLEAALIIVFGIWSRAVGNNFMSYKTLVTILDSLTLSSFLAIGAGCLLLAGHLDLSQAAVGAFAGVMIGILIKNYGMPLGPAMLLTILIAAGFGFINGLLVNKFNFASFIGTLAMASSIKGLMYFTSVGPNGAPAQVSFNEPTLRFLGTYRLLDIVPLPIFFTLIAFIVYGTIMSRTKFGMRVYLVGSNPKAAHHAGINPKVILYILFINCAVLAAIAGILGASRLMQGSLQALATSQFTGLTAAVLGGISFGGGRGGLGGTFVGLVILSTFSTGMAMININPYWTSAFQGILLLAALTLDYLSEKSETRLPQRKTAVIAEGK